MLFARKKTSAPQPLPEQERLRETCLKAGRKVDLIVGTDVTLDIIDIRTTTLHVIEPNGRLALAQTFPEISPNRIGQAMEVTFLARYTDVAGGRWLRAGYKTRLAAVEPDYPIGPGRRAPALIVPGPEVLTQFTLRLNFRLAPPEDRDLRVYVWPEKKVAVEVVDISLGGIKFCHAPHRKWSVGTPMTLLLRSDDLELRLEGRSVRDGKMPTGARGGHGFYTSVKFERLMPEAQRSLAKLINELMRHKLSKRSGVGPDAP